MAVDLRSVADAVAFVKSSLKNPQKSVKRNDGEDSRSAADKASVKRQRAGLGVDWLFSHTHSAGELTANYLSADEVHDVALLVLKASLPYAERLKLVKCLLPAEKIERRTVVAVVSSISSFALPVSLSEAMLKWLVAMRLTSRIEEKIMELLYACLFALVSHEQLCPSVCQLLQLTTTRANVTPTRMRTLMDLVATDRVVRNSANAIHIWRLLFVYRLFNPKLVVCSIPHAATKRKQSFRPYQYWIILLRDASAAENQGLDGNFDVLPMHTLSRLNAFSDEDGRGRRKGRSLVDISEIASWETFCESIDRLSLPFQIASFLRNPYLRQYFKLWPEPDHSIRLLFWLKHRLCVLTRNALMDTTASAKNKSAQDLSKLLSVMISFEEFLGEGIPVSGAWLSQYLSTKSDVRCSESLIAALISQLRLYEFSDLKDGILDPLKVLFRNGSVSFQCSVLRGLRNFLGNCATQEWQRLVATVSIESAHDMIPVSVERRLAIFCEEEVCAHPVRSLSGISAFADQLVLLAFAQNGAHPLLIHYAFDVYDAMNRLNADFSIPVFVVPNAYFIYANLVSDNLVFLDRLLVLLTSMLRNILVYVGQRRGISEGMLKTVNSLQHYMIEIVNALWRGKAFTAQPSEDSDLRLADLTEKLEARGVQCDNDTLTFVYHPAFVTFMAKYCEIAQTDDTALLIESGALSSALREKILDYCASQGFHGLQQITDFCFKTIRRRLSVASD